MRSTVHHFSMFLDASTHLYMRVSPSVRPSVRRSVVPSRVFLNAEIDKSDQSDKSNKPDKSEKSLSAILSTFRRIFVQTNLLL